MGLTDYMSFVYHKKYNKRTPYKTLHDMSLHLIKEFKEQQKGPKNQRVRGAVETYSKWLSAIIEQCEVETDYTPAARALIKAATQLGFVPQTTPGELLLAFAWRAGVNISGKSNMLVMYNDIASMLGTNLKHSDAAEVVQYYIARLAEQKQKRDKILTPKFKLLETLDLFKPRTTTPCPVQGTCPHRATSGPGSNEGNTEGASEYTPNAPITPMICTFLS